MPGSFRVLDASRPEEAAEWLASWNAWPEREVFAHPGYLGLYTSPACRALCANWRSESGAVLYPFLIRDLTVERFWPGGMPQAFDITTPYGYGGAFVLGPRNPPDSESFWCAFDAWASDHSVVSEFIRFSLFDQSLLAYPGTRKRRQDNVIRNLDLDPDALWMDFEHKVRKNVKRARSNEVSVDIDTSGESLDEFLTIYQGTMDRRSAGSSYYFLKAYFESMHSSLPGSFAYFHARHRGRIVSTEDSCSSLPAAYTLFSVERLRTLFQ